MIEDQFGSATVDPTEGFLPLLLGALNLGHLHLLPETLDVLGSLGCHVIADVAKADTLKVLPSNIAKELSCALNQLKSVTTNEAVDWFSYYSLRDFRLYGLFFDSLEFNNINTGNPGFCVNRQSFGNAGAMMERAGYETFGKLLDALRAGIVDPPRGLGSKKIQNLWARLQELAADQRVGGKLLEVYVEKFPIESCDNDSDNSISCPACDFSETILDLEIGVLHLGPKTDALRQKGICKVRDLLHVPDQGLFSISGLGRKTVTRIGEVLSVLRSAENGDGSINWQSFCNHLELALLPAQPLDGTVIDAIFRLPSVLREMLKTEDNPAVRSVVVNRIIKPPSERMTLEEVAMMQEPPLTRERIRQIESKFLQRLGSGLMDDDYAQSRFHFRPEFTSPWRLAAQQFSDFEREISLEELIAGLEHCWRLSRQQFAPLIPLIVAILTGELTARREYKQTLLIDQSRLSRGAEPPLDLPLKRMQLGRQAAKLQAFGISRLRSLLKAIELRIEMPLSSNQVGEALTQIQNLVDAVGEDGEINWQRYAELSLVPFLPKHSVRDALDFLRCIIPVSVEVIELKKRSAIASVVFMERSSVAANVRPTMDALATKLKTYGPTIKNIETEVLLFLNSVFVGGNLAAARVQISLDFLNKWSQLDSWFREVDGESSLLQQRISSDWAVPIREVSMFMPVIIAILSGYPLGRPGKYFRAEGETDLAAPSELLRQPSGPVDNELSQRIVLRGFRRFH